MEKLQSHGIHIPLFPIFLCLLQFFSLQFISTAYDPPEKYFINCGSNANVNATGRTFTGDMNSGYVTIGKHGGAATDRNQSVDSSSLYQTARIFKQQSWYEFEIDNSSTQLVRLHFLAFSSATDDLSTAIFDVSASEFLLLHNFTAKNNKNSPLIEEFFLSINSTKFRIYFTPQGSSFAFINAIEVFLFSANSPSFNRTTNSPSFPLLQTIYRVNVGGQAIKPDSDTVWRNWDQDDSYLSNPSNAKNSQFYSAKPNYKGNVSEFTAPDLVYQTAKVMDNNNISESNITNATWSFNVNKTASHVGRVHFCDIVSKSLNTVNFTLYVNDNMSLMVNSIDFVDLSAAPFYVDFPVNSDDSGILNVSIGTLSESLDKKAYLNGLEILEVKEGFASVPVEDNSKKINVAVVIGSVAGGLAVICILVVGFLYVLKRRKSKPVETYDWSPVPAFGAGSSHSRLTELTINGSPIPDLHLGLKISFAEIQFATNNFDPRQLIGRGGFGNVYRGILPNGKKIAVKRAAQESGQGLPEFQTEIMVLSKIRHRHLVSLIGYCDERSEMILVYEYMEKGTLRDHLYNSDFPRLSWKQRLEISIGAANGLNYLHKGAAGGIIHRDVKSTNILIDENHVAKVADFGLSKSGPQDETHVSTSVKGTLGYLDPEYFRCQQLTEKSDVYSFGVVLLEVLCARLPIDTLLPREQMNLAEWGLHCKKKGLLEEIIDPSLRGQIDPNSLRKFSDIAEKCLQEDGADRPAMSDVIWDLEYALQFQQTATRREPHEDTTTGSSAFVLPDMHRFPSLSTTFDRNDMPISTNDFSNTTADEIFSQLRVDDAR